MLLFPTNMIIFFIKLRKNNLNFEFTNLRLGFVLKTSLIFGKISASCPYKLCPYSKKRVYSNNVFQWRDLALHVLVVFHLILLGPESWWRRPVLSRLPRSSMDDLGVNGARHAVVELGVQLGQSVHFVD